MVFIVNHLDKTRAFCDWIFLPSLPLLLPVFSRQCTQRYQHTEWQRSPALKDQRASPLLFLPAPNRLLHARRRSCPPVRSARKAGHPSSRSPPATSMTHTASSPGRRFPKSSSSCNASTAPSFPSRRPSWPTCVLSPITPTNALKPKRINADRIWQVAASDPGPRWSKTTSSMTRATAGAP